jgi:hypothetical protein
MADSSLIDQALLAHLGSDATLLSHAINGIYYQEAPEGAKRFVIVSLVDEHDEGVFNQRAYEDALYMIEARMASTAGGNIQAAAQRIDELLEDVQIQVAGYNYMACYRESRMRFTEVDDADPSIRWFRRGGMYRIQMSL